MQNALLTRASALALSGLTLAALAGCTPNNASGPASVDQAPPPTAAIPLADGGSAGPLATAPAVLPPAPPARVRRLARPEDRYGFIDRADQVGYGFGDAPPDYAFDYNGESPWAWRSDNGYYRVVEPLPHGHRYYYYEPGASEPFLIRDPENAYGYDQGQLVVVYDNLGHPLAPDYADRRADVAGRYLARAEALYRAAQSDRRRAVERAHWQARRDAIQRDQAAWRNQREQDAEWRAYRERDDWQTRWADERLRREAEAARVDHQMNDSRAEARDRDAARAALVIAQAAQARGPGRPGGRPGPGPFGQPPAQAVQGPPPGPNPADPRIAQRQAMEAQRAQLQAQGGRQQQMQEQARIQAQAQQQNQAQAQAQAQLRAQAIAKAQADQQAHAKAAQAVESRRLADQQAQIQARAQAQAQAQAQAKAQADQQVRLKAEADARGQRELKLRAEAKARADAEAAQRAKAQADQQARALAQAQAQAAAAARPKGGPKPVPAAVKVAPAPTATAAQPVAKPPKHGLKPQVDERQKDERKKDERQKGDHPQPQ